MKYVNQEELNKGIHTFLERKNLQHPEFGLDSPENARAARSFANRLFFVH